MELILWRHAQAEDGVPDDARPLTSRGEDDARHVADWLRGRIPDAKVRVIASPTRRTRQTADALGLRVETLDAIGPGASPEAVLAAADWHAAHDHLVIVVGHQPWIGQTAATALAGRPDPWSTRKGGFWWLSRRHDAPARLRAAMSPELLR